MGSHSIGRKLACACCGASRTTDDADVVVRRRLDQPLATPDGGPRAVHDTVTVTRDFPIGSAEVHVDFTHDDVSTIKVSLDAPASGTVVLHDTFGATNLSARECRRDFGAQDGLAVLVGQRSSGAYTIHFEPRPVFPGQGRVRLWELRLKRSA